MGKQTKAQSERLSSLRVYGDVELQKEEGINHVSKRLGTAQRKMAASGKKAGITLGGRGFGKLKQTTIVQLTKYYGLAVRAHPNDVDGMQDAVLATFEHSSSTDEKPQHNKCPVGADSWCSSRRHAPLARSRAHTESTSTHLIDRLKTPGGS